MCSPKLRGHRTTETRRVDWRSDDRRPADHHVGAADLPVSQRERDDVIDALRRHTSEGRLDVDEFGDRVDEVLAAKTQAELRDTLRYLPPLARPPIPRRHLVSRVGLVAAVLVGVVAVFGLVVAVTPLTFGFHPAFFWVAPFVVMKLLHIRRNDFRRDEQTVIV